MLCVGETKEEYEAGLCDDVCAVQLAKCLDGVSAEDDELIRAAVRTGAEFDAEIADAAADARSEYARASARSGSTRLVNIDSLVRQGIG